jgi:hypothetical protein
VRRRESNATTRIHYRNCWISGIVVQRGMIFRSTIVAAAMLVAHPAAAEDHRFEADPVASVRARYRPVAHNALVSCLSGEFSAFGLG